MAKLIKELKGILTVLKAKSKIAIDDGVHESNITRREIFVLQEISRAGKRSERFLINVDGKDFHAFKISKKTTDELKGKHGAVTAKANIPVDLKKALDKNFKTALKPKEAKVPKNVKSPVKLDVAKSKGFPKVPAEMAMEDDAFNYLSDYLNAAGFTNKGTQWLDVYSDIVIICDAKGKTFAEYVKARDKAGKVIDRLMSPYKMKPFHGASDGDTTYTPRKSQMLLLIDEKINVIVENLGKDKEVSKPNKSLETESVPVHVRESPDKMRERTGRTKTPEIQLDYVDDGTRNPPLSTDSYEVKNDIKLNAKAPMRETFINGRRSYYTVAKGETLHISKGYKRTLVYVPSIRISFTFPNDDDKIKSILSSVKLKAKAKPPTEKEKFKEISKLQAALKHFMSYSIYPEDIDMDDMSVGITSTNTARVRYRFALDDKGFWYAQGYTNFPKLRTDEVTSYLR